MSLPAHRTDVVRLAELSDVPRLAEIHVRSWQAAYREILPKEFLAGLSVEQREESWTNKLVAGQTFVVEQHNVVAGFVRVVASEDPNLGEVQSIYLDPDYFRRGLGRSLLAAAEERLADMGFQNAILWVFVDNQAARRFYEAMGWRVEPRTALMELGGRQLTEIRYQKTLR